MSLIFRTLLDVFAELLGGRYVPGPCPGCGRRSLVKYEAYQLHLSDQLSRTMPPPWRCGRCITKIRRRAYRDFITSRSPYHDYVTNRSVDAATLDARRHRAWIHALRSERGMRRWFARRNR